MSKKEVVVIGGGPAGMITAGTGGSCGHKVTLIEKNRQLGKKLLITGKGRCNLTNNADIEEFINNTVVNSAFLYSAFYSFSNYQLINLLKELGLQTKVERGQRVFPVSDKAADVLQALLKYLQLNKVKVIKGEVNDILVKNDAFIICLKDGRDIKADKVVIATGGLSYPITGSTGDGYKFAKKLGHTISPLKPSLVPLEVEEPWVSKLENLTLKNVSIKVYNKKQRLIYQDFGEMLFTDYGLSGPIILSASSHLREMNKEKYSLVIDLKPALDSEILDKRIIRDFKKYSQKIFANALVDLLPQQMIPVIVELSEIPANKVVHQITKAERLALVNLCKNLTMKIRKFRPIKEAIITSGGVSVKEINPQTMESKIIKGLFFAGEIIDVDAYTGGYNLQIAFSTGYLAGINV